MNFCSSHLGMLQCPPCSIQAGWRWEQRQRSGSPGGGRQCGKDVGQWGPLVEVLVCDTLVPGDCGAAWNVSLGRQPPQIIRTAADACLPEDACFGSGRTTVGLCLDGLCTKSYSTLVHMPYLAYILTQQCRAQALWRSCFNKQ